MLEAWSRTRDGTRKLSANFTVAEFACKDGSDPVFVDSSLAALLQKIRDHFGRPVVITSGYRTAVSAKLRFQILDSAGLVLDRMFNFIA